ncbi:MAG: helix-turn-helix domain-containing protein [Ottowia sp.]|uniref:IclR family transcriptional regulator n=1 Tax=Ottowia sp. TaxID=1898956 RepID=UPI003C74907A
MTEAILTVERGMQVLRAFRSARAPLSNTELVRRTSLPKATVSRLTTTLLQMGFIRHVSGKRAFELTTRSAAFGHAYLSGSGLAARVNPFLQALADRLDGSIALAIGDAHEMLYVAYCAGQQVATLRLGVGTVLSMGSTAVGRAYLWGLASDERLRLVSELTESAGAEGGALGQSIEQSFAELRANGACGMIEGYQRATFAIALPVKLGLARTPMSLSYDKLAMGTDISSEKARIAHVMKSAAIELEALMADFGDRP